MSLQFVWESFYNLLGFVNELNCTVGGKPGDGSKRGSCPKGFVCQRNGHCSKGKYYLMALGLVFYMILLFMSLNSDHFYHLLFYDLMFLCWCTDYWLSEEGQLCHNGSQVIDKKECNLAFTSLKDHFPNDQSVLNEISASDLPQGCLVRKIYNPTRYFYNFYWNDEERPTGKIIPSKNLVDYYQVCKSKGTIIPLKGILI